MKGRNAWLAIVGVLVAVAVVVVLVVVSGGGDDDGGDGGQPAGVQEALALVEGIPQSGDRLGAPDAKVVIQEFADLQCPACRTAAEDLLPEIVEKLVKPGTAALVFRPMAFIGPDSVGGALAAAAAAEQDRVWPFIEILYANQGAENGGWLSDELMTSAAESVPGIDVDAWNTFRQGTDATAAVEAAQREADRAQVTSTPTFVITGPKGSRTVVGAVGYAEIEKAVAEVS